MTDASDDSLTPPGPGPEPAAERAAVGNPYYPGGTAPAGPPRRGTDKGLGWTAFGLSIPCCFPCLPLVGLVLAIVTLARKRFQPRWVAVVAVLLGLVGTGLQVALVASDDFWEGIRDGVNESLEEEADDARRSGEPTEIVPSELRTGDCLNDPALKDVRGTETHYTGTVTLLPCREEHDLEVYATLEVPGEDYPGTRAIDKVAIGCFRRFPKFVGKDYDPSVLEVYYYFPTKRSWGLLGDKSVSCVVGHPRRQVTGSLEGSKR